MHISNEEKSRNENDIANPNANLFSCVSWDSGLRLASTSNEIFLDLNVLLHELRRRIEILKATGHFEMVWSIVYLEFLQIDECRNKRQLVTIDWHFLIILQ
jgi:hypothetical protein